MTTRIVIIDNQQNVRDLLLGCFNEVGWEVFDYAYPQIGLLTLKKHQPDLVILDFETRDHPDAWEFLQLMSNRGRNGLSRNSCRMPIKPHKVRADAADQSWLVHTFDV
jgi:DNA-binding NtrC family response regulator